MGANDYALRSLLDGEPAIALQILQSPGANALDTAAEVRATMDRLSGEVPDGLVHRIAYDPTIFVKASIESVIVTLIEATLLVVLVVIIFLQTWRASIIPLVAVPVPLVGTLLFMFVFGFSLHTLSLFVLVLSFGLLVVSAVFVV